MSDSNKSKILGKFRLHKGEHVLSHGKVYRLIGVGEDSMDYYWILYDGRKIHWATCVGRFMVLKNRLSFDDYNEICRLAKINHHDQLNFHIPKTDEQKAVTLKFNKQHIEEITKLDEDSKFLTELCWDIN